MCNICIEALSIFRHHNFCAHIWEYGGYPCLKIYVCSLYFILHVAYWYWYILNGMFCLSVIY